MVAMPAKLQMPEAPIQIGPLEVQALKEWPEIERLRNMNGELLSALKGITERYVGLVESGDAGFWNPHGESEVQLAYAAIAKAEGQ